MKKHFFFKLQLLYQIIAGLDYGYMNDKNNEASVNNLWSTENAVGQTASQMWSPFPV